MHLGCVDMCGLWLKTPWCLRRRVLTGIETACDG